MVFTGWCTRLVPWFTGLDKRYIAQIRFGEETDTLDPEGEIIATSSVPTESDVRKALAFFSGEIDQVPPIYSAIHTGGERAHRLARAGKIVELPSRKVKIYDTELLTFQSPHATISVHCSKGTYIRALARDIGRRAGSTAHLRELRRTQIGSFSIEAAKSPTEIDMAVDCMRPEVAFDRLGGMVCAQVSQATETIVRNGGRIDPTSLSVQPEDGGEALVVDREGRMIAIIGRSGERYNYHLVVPDDRMDHAN